MSGGTNVISEDQLRGGLLPLMALFSQIAKMTILIRLIQFQLLGKGTITLND